MTTKLTTQHPDAATVEVSMSADLDVQLNPDPNGGIVVHVEGDEARVKAIRVVSLGGTLKITEPPTAGGVTSIRMNGGVVAVSGSYSGDITVINHGSVGRVIVNGVDVTESVKASQPGPAKVTVLVPPRDDRAYDLTLNGQSVAEIADVGTMSLHADVNGSARLRVDKATGDAAIEANGSSVVSLGSATGELEIEANGCAGVMVASGIITKLKVEANGTAKVNVGGTSRRGKFEANGCASIVVAHCERVTRRDVGGVARINIRREG